MSGVGVGMPAPRSLLLGGYVRGWVCLWMGISSKWSCPGVGMSMDVGWICLGVCLGGIHPTGMQSCFGVLDVVCLMRIQYYSTKVITCCDLPIQDKS